MKWEKLRLAGGRRAKLCQRLDILSVHSAQCLTLAQTASAFMNERPLWLKEQREHCRYPGAILTRTGHPARCMAFQKLSLETSACLQTAQCWTELLILMLGGKDSSWRYEYNSVSPIPRAASLSITVLTCTLPWLVIKALNVQEKLPLSFSEFHGVIYLVRPGVSDST